MAGLRLCSLRGRQRPCYAIDALALGFASRLLVSTLWQLRHLHTFSFTVVHVSCAMRSSVLCSSHQLSRARGLACLQSTGAPQVALRSQAARHAFRRGRSMDIERCGWRRHDTGRRQVVGCFVSVLVPLPAAAIVAVGSRQESDSPRSVKERLPGRARLLWARHELQHIDDTYIELFAEDKGAGIRKSMKRVINELGPLPALARELAEDPTCNMDFDALMPLLDTLGSRFALATNWTIEADDCWNSSCNVQEIDEARESMLDAIGILMQIERL